MINGFKGIYYYLALEYKVPVIYKDIKYESAECAFLCQMIENPEEQLRLSELNASEIRVELNRLNDLNETVKDWHLVRDAFMYEVCRAKFNQNPELMAQLVLTGNRELIYDNSKTTYWGKVNGFGLNKLGKILMTIRSEGYNPEGLTAFFA